MNTTTETFLRRLSDTGSLPTLPTVVDEGLRLLQDERASLREVGDLLASDPILAARILRLVNSTLYGLRTKVRTIQEGVLYLGSEQVRNLLLSSSVVDTLVRRGFDLRPYWEHAFGSGYVASRVARLLGACNADDAYLGGLFHDLGRILLVVREGARYEEVLKGARRQGAGSLIPLEREAFGTDHADIGAHVAERWHFPDRVVNVVRHHHHPAAAQDYVVDAAVVQLADYLCASRGLIDAPEEMAPTELAEEGCWRILERHLPGEEALDPQRLLHEADTMVHSARLLVAAVYEG